MRKIFSIATAVLLLVMCVALGDDARSEPLAIVVGAGNSLTDLSMSDLTKIFRGEESKTPDGTRYILTMREKGSAERDAALRDIYQMSEDDYAKYFLQATFSGVVKSAPRVVGGAGGMKRFITSNPGAIGYLRLSDLDDSVRPLKIDGKKPGDNGYVLTIP